MEKVYNIDEVIDQYNLSKNYPNYYKFIVNRNDSIITEYNNEFYVLLEDSLDRNRESTTSLISINDFSYLKWRDLWIEKSDYIEYYYSNIVGKYKLIDESINYYLGLCENAILYLYDYTDYKDVGFISHKYYNNNLLSNPLNLKVDVKERDFSEYLKNIFFNNEYKSIDICKLLEENKDYYNFELVIARMLYPNYYFNLFDKVILLEENESILYPVISRHKEYEEYLGKIIECVSNYFEIKKIDWL